MPLLAFVSNPPRHPRSRRASPVRRENPLKFTGPSLTLMPFNPFQKVSIDLFGASFQPVAGKPAQSNPYKQTGAYWEVPERLWPDNMKPKDFDAYVQTRHGLDVRELVEGRFKVPGYNTPDERIIAVNESRASRGLPMLTHEEWRRWVILDVVGQLYEEEEIAQSDRRSRKDPEFATGPLVMPRARTTRREGGPGRSAPSRSRVPSRAPLAEDREALGLARKEAERAVEEERRLRIAAMRAELERRQAAREAGITREGTAKAAAMLRGLVAAYRGQRDELAEAIGISEQRLTDFLVGRYAIPGVVVQRIDALANKHGVRVANPATMPRQRNRDHRWREPPEEEEVSLDEVKHLPGYAKALKQFKRFHKTDPQVARIIRVPDGRKKTSLANGGVHVFLGHREQTPYTVPFGSKKDTRWYHDHPEGDRPSILLDPATGLVMDVGGTYMVDDWFYS